MSGERFIPSVASLLVGLSLGDKANGENGLHACAEIYGEGELEEEDGGEAVLEFKVHGLVVPYFHAEPCPYASANDSKQEQGRFRYAPPAFPCLEFVNAIDKEGYGIDYKQVIYDYQMYIHLTTI